MEARPPGGSVTVEPSANVTKVSGASCGSNRRRPPRYDDLLEWQCACTFTFCHVAGQKRSRGLVWVLNGKRSGLPCGPAGTTGRCTPSSRGETQRSTLRAALSAPTLDQRARSRWQKTWRNMTQAGTPGSAGSRGRGAGDFVRAAGLIAVCGEASTPAVGAAAATMNMSARPDARELAGVAILG